MLSFSWSLSPIINSVGLRHIRVQILVEGLLRVGACRHVEVQLLVQILPKLLRDHEIFYLRSLSKIDQSSTINKTIKTGYLHYAADLCHYCEISVLQEKKVIFLRIAAPRT